AACKIEDSGVEYLANALQNNRILATLNLSSNKFKEDGAKHLANALRNNEVMSPSL
ncbi:unnamed protein product, partial [Rotaria magnacalcarata]